MIDKELQQEFRNLGAKIEHNTQIVKAVVEQFVDFKKTLDIHTEILNKHTQILDFHSIKLDVHAEMIGNLATDVEEIKFSLKFPQTT